MGTVHASLGMSLDGFIAGPNAGPDNALGDGGMRIHRRVYDLEAWRERQVSRRWPNQPGRRGLQRDV